VGNTDELDLEEIEIPGDMSSAAFLDCGRRVVKGSRLVLEGVGVNWTRNGFLRILERMGAIVLCEAERGGFGPGSRHATSTFRMARSKAPQWSRRGAAGASTSCRWWLCWACFAEGETVVRGAQELRVKESDSDRDRGRRAARPGRRHRSHPDGFAVRA